MGSLSPRPIVFGGPSSFGLESPTVCSGTSTRARCFERISQQAPEDALRYCVEHDDSGQGTFAGRQQS